jgi:DNA (cytosine-5)-methyltransferase 1
LQGTHGSGRRISHWANVATDKSGGYQQKPSVEDGGDMRFGSVCSGIEAASQAWNPLGWEASWLAEIEPFPCSVLAHHYPETPNFGDMTQFESWPNDEQHAIDLLCGGTPCQSFSVAGLRKGLDDARGNLMLTFATIAAKYRPKWLVWENVPGVLSSNSGRDFASFLGLLSGQIIEVPKEGWGNSGIITGYENAYSLAYRVLDAQYFGVAQRRKRVFVVGCLGANRSAAAVLFERHSLSGDIAPRREKIQSVAGTITSGAFTGGAGGRPEGAAGNHFIPTIIDRAAFNQGENALYEPLIEQSETMPTIVARGPHAVLQHCQEIAPTLNAHFGDKQGLENQHIDGGAGLFVTYALAGNTIGRQPENGGNGNGYSEDVSYTLTKTDLHGVCTPTLTSNGDAHSGFRDENGLVVAPIAYAFDGLSSNSMKSSNPDSGCNEVNTAKTIDTNGLNPACNQGGNAVVQQMQVRRLTPTECERLQGFSDGYTNVPHRGKPAADGNRYKALGNSWAVPVAAWVGKRIQEVEAIHG